MDTSALLDAWRGALTTASAVGAPFLLATLAMGLVASLLQAATQMNENILSFVPKLMAVGVVLIMSGNWILDQLTVYTTESIQSAQKIGLESRQ